MQYLIVSQKIPSTSLSTSIQIFSSISTYSYAKVLKYFIIKELLIMLFFLRSNIIFLSLLHIRINIGNRISS